MERERNLIALTFVDPDGIVARSELRSAGAFDVRIASLADLVRTEEQAMNRTPETDLAYFVSDELLR